jgi:uncharacterized protein involved in exopolysaccharide biosynthesis
MNNIVPYEFEAPATPDVQARPYPNQRISLRYIVGVILSRAWPALCVAAIVFLLVVGFVSQISRTYYAEGAVLIQPRRANLTRVEQQPESILPPDTSAIDTEVEVLRSRALAEEVVKRLKLYDDPEFNSALVADEPAVFHWMWPVEFDIELPFSWRSLWPFWSEETQAVAGADNSVWIDRTVMEVQQHTFVRRVGLTYVVRVAFGAHSPEKAQIVADEFITAYMDRQLSEKVALVERANGDLDGSLAKLRDEALDAESKAQEYKNRNNLMSVEGATMAEAEVSNLNRQIAEAKADRAEKDARVAEALAQVRRGGGGADVNAALTSDTIRELRAREAEKSVQLAQLTVRFKDDYPEVKRTQAELNDVRDQPHPVQPSVRSKGRAAKGGLAAFQPGYGAGWPGIEQSRARRTRGASAARGCGEEDLRGLSDALERSRRGADASAAGRNRELPRCRRALDFSRSSDDGRLRHASCPSRRRCHRSHLGVLEPAAAEPA